MKQPAAIVAPAVDISAVTKRVHLAHVAVQDAERAEDAAVKQADKRREVTARARLDLGRALVEARKAWPASGPKAKGWGDFLRDLGIPERTARHHMELAGFVGEVSAQDDDGAEIPTRSEMHEARAERRTDDEPASDDGPSDIVVQHPRITDEEREAAYRREVDAGRPEPMERREQATHSLVAFVSEARAQLRRITERNLHLTDVTTSPEDFMRAKQMFIDIVNLCLDELSKAGVLDGKEQRRQMQLLKGGLE